MPKRSNPFGDLSSLHLKTSICGKDVGKGVIQQTSIQSMYACHNCSYPLQSRDVLKCHFCDNYNCCNCMGQCGGCHLHYCRMCFKMNNNKPAEKILCLNCQRK